MALPKRSFAPALPIEPPRELTRDDLQRLHTQRWEPPTPAKLRDSHHRVARLAAAGLRNADIAQRTGYSLNRVWTLLCSPAMIELIARYREKVDAAFIERVDEYYELATSNMLAAERHVADHIAELDETGELLPVKTALAISRDAADRFGYNKKQTNLNVNVDFAAQLEKAIARSGKLAVVESKTQAVTGVRPHPSLTAPAEAQPQPFRRRA